MFYTFILSLCPSILIISLTQYDKYFIINRKKEYKMSSNHMLGQPALAQLISRTNKSESEKKEQKT